MGSFFQWGLKNNIAKEDLTGTDFQVWFETIIAKLIEEVILSTAWFGDTDIAAGTLSGNYKTLVDDYLVMAVCNYVMSELPEGLNYQYWNKGVSQKTVDNATQPSMSEMYSIVAKYKNRAEHYSKRARMYLIQNGNAMFPEYYTFVAGVDTVYPDRTSFTSPIYLGNEVERPRDDYSLNNVPPAGYNSNDPYYI